MNFQNLENLGRLNLSNNNMDHFPIEISLLPDLMEFHFDQSSGRKIEELPEEVGNSTLFHLYLDNNAISQLPGAMVKVGPLYCVPNFISSHMLQRNFLATVSQHFKLPN